MSKKKEIIPAAVLGCAIGDALGMPFEMRGRAKHPQLEQWGGTYDDGTYHKLEKGSWTDDTEMTICLARSLIDKGDFVGEDIANNYVDWYKGNPIGMGSTTRDALEKLVRAKKMGAEHSYRYGGRQNFPSVDEVGAGTVMRVAPIGVFFSEQPDMIRMAARLDADITHRHSEAYAASLAVAATIAGVIRIREPDGNFHRRNVVRFLLDQMTVVSDSITARVLEKVFSDGTGFQYVPEEVADRFAGRFGNAWQIAVTSIHCALFHLDKFGEGVQAAIRLGGDTDTRGAVTGAIMGAVVGLDALHTKYKYFVNGVKHSETLATLDRTLWERRPR